MNDLMIYSIGFAASLFIRHMLVHVADKGDFPIIDTGHLLLRIGLSMAEKEAYVKVKF